MTGGTPDTVLVEQTFAGWATAGGETLPENIPFRRFGSEPGDLDIDFTRDAREDLVTELLLRTWRDGGGDRLQAPVAWAWPVGVRLKALLWLCLLGGRRGFAWTLQCPGSGCRESIEITLPLDVLLDKGMSGGPVGTRARLSGAGGEWWVRLPTGEDLRRWGSTEGGEVSDQEMLASLLSRADGWSHDSGEPREVLPELLEEADTILSGADPLVDVQVEAACPTCGESFGFPVDLREEALAALAAEQDEFFRQIECLAREFHWSDRDILAMPASRRRRYLELVGWDANRIGDRRS